MVYADNESFAIFKNCDDWSDYATKYPNAPTLDHLEELIEEASGIINQYIGSYDTDITDSRFISRVQKLCLRMVERMRQIEKGQGLQGRIPLFSPNDFLIERERTYLQFTIGVALGYRVPGGVG